MSVEAIQRTDVDPAAMTDRAQDAAPRAETGRVVSKPTAYEQFEAFVLQSFIQSIMPKEASSVFGEGTAGEVWKSMLAEKIAMQVAEAGGVGIAKVIGPGKAGESVQPSEEGKSSGPGNVAQSLLEWQLNSAPAGEGAGAAAALHAGGGLAAAARKSGL